MRITFLGTGTSMGIPVIGLTDPVNLSKDPRDTRLRTSVLLQWKDRSYVIDCGPDFRQQMLAARVDRLDGILFTHYHADHTAGLDDIRSYTQRFGDMRLFARSEVAENLKERFDYIFRSHNRYAGAPSVELVDVNTKPFPLHGKIFQPIEVWHGRLPILGYRIDDFAYLTDVKSVEDAAMEQLTGLDVLVVNALRIEPHPTHFNLEEALDFITRLAPKRAFLTHISHRLGLHEEVSKILPDNVFLAYDGLQIESGEEI